MKKIFGVQAEINLTADEEIIKGIGKGLSNGSIEIVDIFRELKPDIAKAIKYGLFENEKKENKENK